MPSTTRSGRHPGAGRKPAGPNGEPRDKLVAVKVARTERDNIFTLLRRRGLPANATGIRALLLDLVDADDGTAA